MCLNEPNFNIEEFDRYLDQIMTPAERQAFEAKLNSDEYYKEAFILHRAIVGAVRKGPQREKDRKLSKNFRHYLKYENEQRFKIYLEERMSAKEKTVFLQELKADDLLHYQFEKFQAGYIAAPVIAPVRRISSRTGASSWLLRIAAVFFLGIACLAGVYYLFTPKPTVNYAINDEFPDSEMAMIESKPEGMDIPDSIHDLKYKGLAAYDNEQYLTSIESLEAYVKFFAEGDEDIAFLQLYIAWSYFEKNEIEAAVSILKTAIEDIHSTDYILRKEYMLWYLAVAYVSQEKYAAAKITLQELLKTGKHEDLKLKSNNLLNLLP